MAHSTRCAPAVQDWGNPRRAPFVGGGCGWSGVWHGSSRAPGAAPVRSLRCAPFQTTCQENPVTRDRLARPALFAVLAALSIGAAHAGGLDIHTDVDADEVGLPVYPGATRGKDDGGSPAGFSFGAWGAVFGVKLAVAGYHSSDAVPAVAAFYRQALRRYGPVLDCTVAVKAPASAASQSGGTDFDFSAKTPVSCGNESAGPGGRLFKVGTNAAQHVFKATPEGTGTRFELIRLEGHADE